MSEAAVKVFISYSWDSSEHKEKVLALSDSLRKDGIDCQIDRYHQSPPEGWHRWMVDQIEESDFVLVVCTEKYNLRYRNKEERGQGRGVTWEGGQIIAELYSEQGINDKYIPVLLSAEGEGHIPRSLQTYTVYRLLSSDDYDLNKQGEYQNLYRHLTKQPAYVPAQLGKPQRLLPINGNDLASEKGVIYTKLCNFLANKNWYLADQETYEVMIQALGKQSGKTFGREELLNFPCTDIQTIDRLWVKYSGGRFGFSVQKRIYVECGARLDGEYPDPEIWHTFCKRVGWQLNGKSVEAMFDLSAPLGHLPFKDKQVSLCFAPSGNYNSYDLLPNALLSHQGL